MYVQCFFCRSNLAGNDLINDKNTGDAESSPEFLPPRAKIKRHDHEETIASEVSQTKRPEASQSVENTDSKMIPDEKLNLIKLQEEKIEELLKCLELKAEEGWYCSESFKVKAFLLLWCKSC